jgi:hypothetical protein
MRKLALTILLALAGCGSNGTGLTLGAGGSGGTGSGSDPGGGGNMAGAPGRGGTGGSFSGGGGSGGSAGRAGSGGSGGTAGSGGSIGGGGSGGGGSSGGKDAGPPDVKPAPDAGGMLGRDGGVNAQICTTICKDIATQYTDALKAAQMCTVGAANQCQKTVAASLMSRCGCPVAVNSTEALDKIRASWTDAGCNQCLLPVLCPAIACLAGAGTCVASSSGGVCVSQRQPLP